ncbi:MAG: response regulator [Clostridia bacterium]|nr:response regulator [Clostridia bacterium]
MFNNLYKEIDSIKIIVIDDDFIISDKLCKFLAKNEKFEICACFKSGIDVIKEMNFYKPDLVIADVSAKDHENESVFKKLSGLAENKPDIITMSSLKSDDNLEELFKIGIKYHIRKPIIFSLLEDAIYSVFSEKPSGKHISKIGKIKKFVRLLGVPTNILGYTYICESLNYMTENTRVMFLNEIYKLIAKDNITSSESVEVSIRNAIKKTIKVGSDEFLKIFGETADSLSNSKFLTTIKEILYEKFL